MKRLYPVLSAILLSSALASCNVICDADELEGSTSDEDLADACSAKCDLVRKCFAVDWVQLYDQDEEACLADCLDSFEQSTAGMTDECTRLHYLWQECWARAQAYDCSSSNPFEDCQTELEDLMDEGCSG